MCYICKYNQSKIKKELQLGIFFLISLIIFPFVTAPSGNSTFFTLEPNCSINQTIFFNCTQQPFKMNCKIENFQFVQFVSYNFNSTAYIASQLPNPNQKNFTVETTLHQQNQTINEIYNWSNVVITDTSNNIAIFQQGINVSKTCPDCFPIIVQINSSCGSNDFYNQTYNDTSQCSGTILPSGGNISCDFCTPNFQCNNYNPSTCGLDTKFRNCLSVIDLNDCYNQTGLISDNFSGSLNDFIAPCTFADYQLNTSLYSTLRTEFIVNQYPYVETNTTVSMEVIIFLENTRVLVTNVQMQILNLTIGFNQDNSTVSYKRSIVISENGDYPFVIIGRDNSSQVFQIEGIFFARKFVNVTVQLFENKNQSDRYVNNFAHIIALKDANIFKNHEFTEDLLTSIQPIEKTSIFFNKLIKINRSQYYKYKIDKRAFHTEYEDGIAILKVPVEPEVDWDLRLLNSESDDEYIFDGFNFASIRTYDVAGANDIYLTSGHITANLDVKLLVSKWDVRFFETALKWVIIAVIILIFIIAGYFVYRSTEDPTLIVKLGIALLTALPILYVILTWIFN